jgi:peroxiredoxin
MRTRWIAAFAVAVAIALPFMPACADTQEAQTQSTDASGICTADPVPADLNVTLKNVDGADVRLADFKGQPLILNFWATWCPPCLEEIPYFVDLSAKYKDDGVVILGISTDDTPDQIRPYASDLKMNYPVLVGLDQPDVERAFGAMWAIPVTIFVKKDGTICERHQGTQTKEFFESRIKALL